jgi:hypothetical protein
MDMNLPWSSITTQPPEKVHAIVECNDQSVHTKGEFLKLAESISVLETRGTASINAALTERKLALQVEKCRGQCHSREGVIRCGGGFLRNVNSRNGLTHQMGRLVERCWDMAHQNERT